MKTETMARRIRELERAVRALEYILEADHIVAFFDGLASAKDELGT